MIHVPLQLQEVTDENLTQTFESMMLSKKVLEQHWNQLYEGLETMMTVHGVDTEDRETTLGFLRHCLMMTMEDAHKTQHVQEHLQEYGQGLVNGGKPPMEVSSLMIDAMRRAADRVDKATSEEEINAIMAKWDLSGAADEMEDALAMEMGAKIPPSLERYLKKFIRSVLRQDIPDEDIVIEVEDLNSDNKLGFAFARLPSPDEIVAKTNKKRLDSILGGIFEPENGKKDAEKEEK